MTKTGYEHATPETINAVIAQYSQLQANINRHIQLAKRELKRRGKNGVNN